MNDQATAKNRRVRVFVSSTFRDMKEERDELMAQTWPELRRFCRERQVELTEVDLRWGITEEQGSRKETLKICLDEIHSCRPFFIGLLGERYGWVPDADSFTPDLKGEQPWLNELQDRSVTELEILHGVLNAPEMAGRAFFYFRDPVYSQTRGADFQAESPAAAEKQAELKAKIRATCVVKNIPLKETYANPRELAALVLKQLEDAIETLFPKEEVPDDLTREAQDHEAFAETRRRTYIGRAEIIEALDRHAMSEGKPLTILGESGGGKSALLANWVRHWRESHPNDFIIQHYIGGTSDSASYWRLMSRLIREIQRWTNDPEGVPTSHDDLLRDFPLWLSKVRIKAEHEGVRCILVLDALNQLEDVERARLLGWLPEHPFFGPLRLIVSTLPGECQDEVQRREWSELLVEPLTEEERKQLIEEYLNRFAQKLETKWVDLIAGKPESANPLYLKILLDELRVTGTHDRLGQRLTEYLDNPDIPSLLRTVLTRYERDYERDRPGLVSEALKLIWAARRGLSESELLRLLRPEDLPQLPQTIWSPLRSALDESLIDRAGILNFAFDYLLRAVEETYIPTSESKSRAHRVLADYYGQIPNITARKADEWPFQLEACQAWDDLEACLTNFPLFLELFEKADREDLTAYWRSLRDRGYEMESAYAAAYERDPSPGALLCYSLGAFLLGNECYGLGRTLTVEAGRASSFGLGSLGELDANFATAQANLAAVLEAQGDVAGAATIYERVLAIHEASFGSKDRFTATACVNLANAYGQLGQWREAESLARRAISIDTAIYGESHPEIANDLSCLAGCLRAARKLSEAEEALRRALSICRARASLKLPLHATIASNLSTLSLQNGRTEEAVRLAEEAVDIDRACFGPEHTKLAIHLVNLGGAMAANGDVVEAAYPAKEALEIFVACSLKLGAIETHLEAAAQLLAGIYVQCGLQPVFALPMVNNILEPLQALTKTVETHGTARSPATSDSTTEGSRSIRSLGQPEHIEPSSTLGNDDGAAFEELVPVGQAEPLSTIDKLLIEMDPRNLRRRAEGGDLRAQCNLAVHCESEGDLEEAVIWYRRAAEHGVALAQYNLGVHLYNGTGGTRDFAEAVAWYRKASDQGYLNATYNLAFMHEHGFGCSKDLREAYRLYEKAAAQGEQDSIAKIAVLLMDKTEQATSGHDYRRTGWDFVTADNEKAHRLFSQLAESGDGFSQEVLDRLGWR